MIKKSILIISLITLLSVGFLGAGKAEAQYGFEPPEETLWYVLSGGVYLADTTWDMAVGTSSASTKFNVVGTITSQNIIPYATDVYSIGSSTLRYDAYFDDVDINTLTVATATISGVVSGNIDMGGYLITDIAGSNFISGGGLTLAGKLTAIASTTDLATTTISDLTATSSTFGTNFVIDSSGNASTTGRFRASTSTFTGNVDITGNIDLTGNFVASGTAHFSTTTFEKDVSISGTLTYGSTTNWDTAYDHINASSTLWSNTYNIVNASSSNWDLAEGYYAATSSNLDVMYNWYIATSGNLDTTYDIVNASSSNWDLAFTYGSAFNASTSLLDVIAASSTNYDLAYTYGLITNSSSSNWDLAYTYGSAYNASTSLLDIVAASSTNWDLAFTYGSAYNASTSLLDIVAASSTNWDLAYGWGDHSLASYLTTVDMSDDTNWAATHPLTISGDTMSLNTASSSLWQSTYLTVSASSSNWDTAYSWGDWGGNIDISDDTNLATSGVLIALTNDTLSVRAGTLTNTKGCKYTTTSGIVCDQDYLTTVDISDNTNLATSTGILLTDDTLSVVEGELSLGNFAGTLSISSTTGDLAFSRISGTLPLASTTGTVPMNRGGTATTTNLGLWNLWRGDGAGNLVQVSSTTLAGAAAGVDSLNTFTGALTIWGKANELTVTASGTEGVVLDLPTDVVMANASTTNISITGLETGFLYVDANGNVSTSTPPSALWTDGGTETYLTATGDDFVVGSNASPTSAFYIDVSTGNAYATGTFDVGGNLTAGGVVVGSNITEASTTNWDLAFTYGSAFNASTSLLDIIAASSTNYDLAYTYGLITNSSSSNWDLAYTYGSAYNASTSLLDIIAASSTNYDLAYTYGSAYNSSSSDYDTAYDHINASSTLWSNAYTIVNSSSSNWDVAYGHINASSTLWSNAYTIVNSNSSNWDLAYTYGLAYNASSSDYDGAVDTITASSSNWDVAAGRLDQSVKTGDTPTFAGINTGLGSGEVVATSSFTIIDPNSTTTKNPRAAHSFPNVWTITKVKGFTDSGTTTIQFDERGETTPNAAGTDVMTTPLVLDSNLASTSAFDNAEIAADAWLSLDIDTDTATTVTITIYYAY